MLIIFGGRPGTGKTTIARALVQRQPIAYLRIDVIEHAIAMLGKQPDVGPAGYLVAYEIAKCNLLLGNPVLADCVNPLQITRKAWREVAKNSMSPYIEIEVICSDLMEHENRVNSRKTDIHGFKPPSWSDVLRIEYEPWETSCLVIDTSLNTVDEAVETILERWRWTCS